MMSADNCNLIEFKIVPGIRKNSKLLHIPSENQIYKYKYEKNLTKYYVCYVKNCPVNVAVDFNNEQFCRKTSNIKAHNHHSQEDFIKKLKLINEIKSNCENVSLKRSNVREVFDETCKKFKNNNIQFGQMRRNLYKIKNKIFPKSPRTFPEIIEIFEKSDILKTFGFSRYEKTENFYKNTVIEEQYSYSIFLSPSICSIIDSMAEDQPRNYLIDGTFSITPYSNNQFKQLLIIHIAHNEHVSNKYR